MLHPKLLTLTDIVNLRPQLVSFLTDKDTYLYIMTALFVLRASRATLWQQSHSEIGNSHWDYSLEEIVG
jgi:hypothetical protein